MSADVDSLIAAAREDELVLRRVSMVEEEFVFLKCVLEAYPGLAIVVAPRVLRTASSPRGAKAELTVVGARGCGAELDELLAELGAEKLAGEA